MQIKEANRMFSKEGEEQTTESKQDNEATLTQFSISERLFVACIRPEKVTFPEIP